MLEQQITEKSGIHGYRKSGVYERASTWCGKHAYLARLSLSRTWNIRVWPTRYNVRPIVSGYKLALAADRDRYIDQEKGWGEPTNKVHHQLFLLLLVFFLYCFLLHLFPIFFFSFLLLHLLRFPLLFLARSIQTDLPVLFHLYRSSGQRYRGKLMGISVAAWIEWRLVLIGIKPRVFHEWIKPRVASRRRSVPVELQDQWWFLFNQSFLIRSPSYAKSVPRLMDE